MVLLINKVFKEKNLISDTLDEREFELINILGPQISANQRDLSKRSGMSLGLVNMVLRRLIAKGCIRMDQLNKRKVRYFLTPKGFSQKMKISVGYMWKTINSISRIKESLESVLVDLYEQNHRKFFIYGQSDFGKLIESVFLSDRFFDCDFEFIDQMPQYDVDGVLLICKENVAENGYNIHNRIDLVSELVKYPNSMNDNYAI